jgi:quinol monooxygenase YgiN
MSLRRVMLGLQIGGTRHFARGRTVALISHVYPMPDIRTRETGPMKKSSYTLGDLNDGFVVVVMLEAKEGEADAVAEIQRKLLPPTLAEPGVKAFIPYRSPANPSLFFIYELYVDEAAWGAHQETAHFKALIPDLVARVARRERIPFVPFMAI